MNWLKRRKSDPVWQKKPALPKTLAICLSILLLNTSLLLSFTEMQEVNAVYRNQQSVVKAFICSHGCYQFLIEINLKNEIKYFYPDSLPEKFKQDNLEIIIGSAISPEKKQVFKL